jgi:serine/threonine protein kinase
MAKIWQKGELIGNQYLVARVSEGGMGMVYIGYDTKHKYPVALKTFRTEPGWDDLNRKSLRAEALLWMQLPRHPNIVIAETVFTSAGQTFLVLEYVPGYDLDQWLHAGPLQLRRVLGFAAQFCRGMSFAFRQVGLVHRDIKPANILISENDHLKITDFGIAKAVETAVTFRETLSLEVAWPTFEQSTPIGSLPWMAPEQIEGRRVDTRTDIYSFGVVLYQMLSGRHPYQNVAGSWKERHLGASIPGLKSDVPTALGAIVLKCLAKDPSHRYSTFDEIMEHLRPVYEREVGSPLAFQAEDQAASVAELNNRGNGFVALGRHSQAISCFDQGLALEPNDPILMSSKARALGRIGRLEEEIALYRKVLLIDPTNGLTWSNLGKALRDQGMFDEALRAFSESFKYRPDHPNTLTNKAQALLDKGNLEEAEQCAGRAIELFPDLENAWTNRGLARLYQGKSQEALADFDQSLKIDEWSADGWYNSGLPLMCFGRFSEAVQRFGKAIELKPDSFAALYWMGLALLCLNQPADSLVFWDRVLGLSPTDASAQRWRELAKDLISNGTKISGITIQLGRMTVELKPE